MFLSWQMRADTNEEENTMVAGHLREQNGIYQMILSYKDVNGKRKTKSFSTGLKIRGNARKADRMLQQLRQEFKAPDMHPDYGKDVDLEESPNDGQLESKEIVPSNELSQSAATEAVVVKTDIPQKILPEQIEIVNETPIIDENLFLKPKNEILFCDYMIYWLESIRKNVAEDTFAGYSYAIKQRIYPYFKNKQFTLADLEEYPFLISDYYSFEMKTYGISANTIYHRHANIRKALQYALKYKIIRSNPADLIDKPSKDSFESSVYSKDELRELFMAFVGDPLELAVMLASFYGLRRSEIVGLKWRAIDFVRKTITVQHVVTQATVDGEYKLVKKNRTKTKASNRSLPLVPQFEQALRKLLERQQLNRKVFGNAYSTEYLDYILVNELGELMKPGFITQHFGLVRDKNNLKFIRFHDLRHSCATLLYDNGVSLKDIQEWLGHSNIATTANIYTHLNYKNKINSANAIMSLLPGENEKELAVAAN